MAFEKLKRTNYNHSGSHSAKDHHQDYEEFQRPLNEMQNANLFDWGIVKGLNVTGTIGSNELQVHPGMGIDIGGRLISLATGGQGDIGDNPIGDFPQNKLVPVPVTLNTAGHEGETVKVTIEYSEFFSKSPVDNLDPGDFELIPWVRLQKISLAPTDGSALILAEITIDASGNITSIDGNERKVVETSLGKLSLRKGIVDTSTDPHTIKEDTTIQADGKTGTLTVGAEGQSGKVILRNDVGSSTVEMVGSTGDLHIGGQGADGALFIKNRSNQITARIDGNSGNLDISGNGFIRNLFAKNAADNTRVHLDGQTGNIILHGQLRNASNQNIGLNLFQKQDLTDGGKTTLHKHDLGSISRDGGVGTKIGIIEGFVRILGVASNANTSGSVRIRFSSRSHTTTGSGFKSKNVLGFQGNFSAKPHVIVAPNRLGLSTNNDTFFRFTASISETHLSISWLIDGDDAGEFNEVHFLVVGPIAN